MRRAPLGILLHRQKGQKVGLDMEGIAQQVNVERAIGQQWGNSVHIALINLCEPRTKALILLVNKASNTQGKSTKV